MSDEMSDEARKVIYRFANGEILDLSDFKGCFIDKDIRNHFGNAVADRISKEVSAEIHRRFNISVKCKD